MHSIIKQYFNFDTECNYAVTKMSVNLPSVILQSAFWLSAIFEVILMSVIFLGVILLHINLLNAFLMSVIQFSVILLNVSLLSVFLSCHYYGCSSFIIRLGRKRMTVANTLAYYDNNYDRKKFYSTGACLGLKIVNYYRKVL